MRAVKKYVCPICHNEEHLPGARFCMVCGTAFPLAEQPPPPGPCSLCDYGGQHLDAPPCSIARQPGTDGKECERGERP